MSGCRLFTVNRNALNQYLGGGVSPDKIQGIAKSYFISAGITEQVSEQLANGVSMVGINTDGMENNCSYAVNAFLLHFIVENGNDFIDLGVQPLLNNEDDDLWGFDVENGLCRDDRRFVNTKELTPGPRQKKKGFFDRLFGTESMDNPMDIIPNSELSNYADQFNEDIEDFENPSDREIVATLRSVCESGNDLVVAYDY